MITRNTFLALAAVALASAFAAPAQARAPQLGSSFLDPRPGPQIEAQNRAVRAPHDLIPIVRGQLGGRFIGQIGQSLEVRRPYYVFRWEFPNGDVRDIRVDAETGAVIG